MDWPHFPFLLLYFTVFMEQLTTLSSEPGDQDSAAKSLAVLKAKQVEEMGAREKAQVETETLAYAVEDLKKIADRFATQILALEDKVKHLDNKVLDMLNEVHAKELSLERVTKANEDYKSQNARLTKMLESKLPLYLSSELCFLLQCIVFITNPASTHRI
jgi:chromosome segregation ATPase